MLRLKRIPWIAIAKSAGRGFLLFAGLSAAAQAGPPEVLRFSPPSGPEGTRVEIIGGNLVNISAVLFGGTGTAFKPLSPEKVVAIVPHRVFSSNIVVVTPQGRGASPSAFVVTNDPRIPDEVSYKAGYVNPVRAPADFNSARLWGIAIADTRVPGHESAQVEVAWTRLTCQIDGREVVLNDDSGQVRGGLYQRQPWFASDAHAPIPLAYDPRNHSVVLAVGQPQRSGVALLEPVGAGCTAGRQASKVVPSGPGCMISPGALLQMGMDYWRTPTIPYGSGGNNHEAGASNWYFPSPHWQEATFTDIGGPQF